MTTSLSELVSCLALLAGPHPYHLTARLLADTGGIELKATCNEPGARREFARHVTFSALDHLGAAIVAREFARAARLALTSTEGSTLWRAHKSHW